MFEKDAVPTVPVRPADGAESQPIQGWIAANLDRPMHTALREINLDGVPVSGDWVDNQTLLVPYGPFAPNSAHSFTLEGLQSGFGTAPAAGTYRFSVKGRE